MQMIKQVILKLTFPKPSNDIDCSLLIDKLKISGVKQGTQFCPLLLFNRNKELELTFS